MKMSDTTYCSRCILAEVTPPSTLCNDCESKVKEEVAAKYGVPAISTQLVSPSGPMEPYHIAYRDEEGPVGHGKTPEEAIGDLTRDDEYPNAKLDDNHISIGGEATLQPGPDGSSFKVPIPEQASLAELIAKIDANRPKPPDPLFEQFADISRSSLPPSIIPEVERPWIPDAGGNGIDVPKMLMPAVHEYGKALTRSEILRITNEFRDALSVPTEITMELDALAAKEPATLTLDDTGRAGEIRKLFKAKRVDTEHRRKFLKEKALRTGQMIDSCANAGKNFCAQQEEKAEAVEKYLEREEAARRVALDIARAVELSPFFEGDTKSFNLGTMSKDQYQILLSGAKMQHSQRQQELRDAEDLRRQNEARDRAERERNNKKIERVNQLSALGLRYDGDQGYAFAGSAIHVRELDVASFRDDTWAELIDTITGDVGDINDAKAAEKAEAERQAQIDRENARIAQEQLDKIEAEKKAKADAERAAALAPDKDKMIAYFTSVHDAVATMPDVSDENAKALLQIFFDEAATLVNRYGAKAGAL